MQQICTIFLFDWCNSCAAGDCFCFVVRAKWFARCISTTATYTHSYTEMLRMTALNKCLFSSIFQAAFERYFFFLSTHSNCFHRSSCQSVLGWRLSKHRFCVTKLNRKKNRNAHNFKKKIPGKMCCLNYFDKYYTFPREKYFSIIFGVHCKLWRTWKERYCPIFRKIIDFSKFSPSFHFEFLFFSHRQCGKQKEWNQKH